MAAQLRSRGRVLALSCALGALGLAGGGCGSSLGTSTAATTQSTVAKSATKTRTTTTSTSTSSSTSSSPAASTAASTNAASTGAASGSTSAASTGASTGTTTTATAGPPGCTRPEIAVGDKNSTEQFILGELYTLSLTGQGYNVSLTQNIGTTAVTIGALRQKTLDLYPEYLNIWDSTVAGSAEQFTSLSAAYDYGANWAAKYGLDLLTPTPFSDTGGVAVTYTYALNHDLRKLYDLRTVAPSMRLGWPPQLVNGPTGLTAVEQAYGFTPAVVSSVDVGNQYQALSAGLTQANWVSTTDGELATSTPNGTPVPPRYLVLRDNLHVFGFGRVVPVLASRVVTADGISVVNTINLVDSLLTMTTMRQLNADVDIYHETVDAVARRFLQQSGIPISANCP
jgi:osmoprotectant transport system substrate-binding protein